MAIMIKIAPTTIIVNYKFLIIFKFHYECAKNKVAVYQGHINFRKQVLKS